MVDVEMPVQAGTHLLCTEHGEHSENSLRK